MKLERFRAFLARINNPHKKLRCIHVAGSKGKGSTCAFIAYILRESGYKVGLYTSPHLSDFRERIRILAKSSFPTGNDDFEGMVPKNTLSRLVDKIKPEIGKFNSGSKHGALSFFEVYTALAFVYFKEKKADFVVLETGLGGRLDATNVVEALVSVITPISYEHTNLLGKTLKAIAGEKAGIIKAPDSSRTKIFYSEIPRKAGQLLASNLVISAPQPKEAMEVVRMRAKEIAVPLKVVGKDILVSGNNARFRIKGLFAGYNNLKSGLPGAHQLINAACAVGAVEALRNFNFIIGEKPIREGILNTRWPGRCELLGRNPYVVLDGAQNVSSAGALKDTIRGYFKYRKLILVLGISRDKDIKGVCGELKSLADFVVLTKSANPRAANPRELVKYFKGRKLCVAENVKEARDKSAALAGKNDLILVTGSLFVVGEFRALKLGAGS